MRADYSNVQAYYYQNLGSGGETYSIHANPIHGRTIEFKLTERYVEGKLQYTIGSTTFDETATAFT
ncbi:MAG: hypothetical protein MJ219_01090 [Mycoplasmoidaceae bacterium]|nr:hypothetical protein [Mycoplasmoidaceae bacterium]